MIEPEPGYRCWVIMCSSPDGSVYRSRFYYNFYGPSEAAARCAEANRDSRALDHPTLYFPILASEEPLTTWPTPDTTPPHPPAYPQ